MYISNKIRHRIHHAIGIIIIITGVFGIYWSVKAYPQVFHIIAQLEEKENIEPRQEIKIRFSEPMLASQTERSMYIIPEVETDFIWQDGNKTLSIFPKNLWKLEEKYQIRIIGGKSLMLTDINADLAFQTVAYPKITEFYPASDEKDVLLDIEDPIKAVFDKPIGNFKVKFVISPLENLVYDINKDGRTVNLLSKNEFKRGQIYKIEVFARYKEEPEDNYHEIFETSFETKPLAPQNWEKDFALRLEQARRFTDPKIMEGKYIDINVKSQIITIFENGKLLDTYLISTGKASMPTSQGTFHIANKTPRAWSKKYGLFMPFWMAVASDGSFGIHELPEWPGGYKEGQFHLGIPVSHGCIRLGVGPAERVYNWTEIGTLVVIHE